MADSIRALVVDDEEPARRLLMELIQDNPLFTEVEQSASGAQAIKDFERFKPDVMFLDIEMPEMNGLQVCQQIDLSATTLVFVTAFPEFALKAFELEATDYVVKPIRMDRFARTLTRVVHAVTGTRLAKRAERAASQSDKRQTLDTVRGKLIIDPDEVDYIESAGNYVKIWSRGVCHLSRCTMGEIAGVFDSEQFLKVHRCFIVNTKQIRQLVRDRTNGCGELILQDDATRIPVSRARRGQVESLLE